ncbi:MAG: sterol desaturase family protein [Oceanospirillaceae bacterium]
MSIELILSDFFNEYWLDISQMFSNSQQRLFSGYLCAAFVIAFIYLVKTNTQHASISQLLYKACGFKHWLEKSALADYKVIFINKAIFMFFIPLLITKLSIATAVFELMHVLFQPRSSLENILPDSFIIAAFTLFVFLFDDFARFLLHKLMHEIPWLWSFHKTHHSATVLTPLTVLRSHPVEGLIFAIRSAIVQGSSIALFLFFFPDQVDLYTVLKVNVFIFVFNMLGSNLRHSHISIRYWRWLETVLISPAQHQIHHSANPHHFNKNYGAAIALWDKIFNSHCYSEKHLTLKFGLHHAQGKEMQSLYRLYIYAFVEIFLTCKSYVNIKRKTKNKSTE